MSTTTNQKVADNVTRLETVIEKEGQRFVLEDRQLVMASALSHEKKVLAVARGIDEELLNICIERWSLSEQSPKKMQNTLRFKSDMPVSKIAVCSSGTSIAVVSDRDVWIFSQTSDYWDRKTIALKDQLAGNIDAIYWSDDLPSTLMLVTSGLKYAYAYRKPGWFRCGSWQKIWNILK